MAHDLAWDHEFCLACDRQTDGNVYCSESCRLSDIEKASPMGSPSQFSYPTWAWTPPKPQSRLVLAPAYDFSNAQPYYQTPRRSSVVSSRGPDASPQSSTSTRILTPSSSHSSLCSLHSNSSSGSGENQRVSDKAKRQLRDYASSFERARLQRQRSY